MRAFLGVEILEHNWTQKKKDIISYPSPFFTQGEQAKLKKVRYDLLESVERIGCSTYS